MRRLKLRGAWRAWVHLSLKLAVAPALVAVKEEKEYDRRD
jgi:hypothetical protein